MHSVNSLLRGRVEQQPEMFPLSCRMHFLSSVTSCGFTCVASDHATYTHASSYLRC